MLSRGPCSCPCALTRFRHHGPGLFVDSWGRESPHGRLLFRGDGDPRNFIVVSDTSSVPLLCQFIGKYWRLPKPEVLITVTGGAQDFSLTQLQRASLDRGLVSGAPRRRPAL